MKASGDGDNALAQQTWFDLQTHPSGRFVRRGTRGSFRVRIDDTVNPSEFWLQPMPRAPTKLSPANVNTGDLETLCLVPGLGAVRAQRLVDQRGLGYDDPAQVRRVLKMKVKDFEAIFDFLRL